MMLSSELHSWNGARIPEKQVATGLVVATHYVYIYIYESLLLLVLLIINNYSVLFIIIIRQYILIQYQWLRIISLGKLEH